MVCEENEIDVDIGIPAVMLLQDIGLNLWDTRVILRMRRPPGNLWVKKQQKI
ncbi:hypothetical protein Fmac_009534 [Flemingia macrophylla]|uniref:Uncharacterized protein n=1 Tax=Flemingia macrophylla TaxID=520843 RepID=A0ABD1N0M1_9FABA